MRWRFNLEALQEDLRRVGIALFIAGIVAGAIQDISIGDTAFATLGGIVLILLGLIQRKQP